jgi:DNA-directed RNA polymerase specialized sigma24 family protein
LCPGLKSIARNLYRAYTRERILEPLRSVRKRADDPISTLEKSIDVFHLLDFCDESGRQIVTDCIEGYTSVDIAMGAGTTAGAVRARKSRAIREMSSKVMAL